MDAEIFRDFAFFNSFLFQRRWISLIMFPLVIAGFAVLNLVTGSAFLFALFLIIALAAPLLYLVYFRISLRNQIRVNHLDQKRLVYTISFENKRIEVANQKERQSLEWTSIYRIYRYKNYFFLYINPSRAFILPERDLQEGITGDDFWEYVQSAAPEGRWVLSPSRTGNSTAPIKQNREKQPEEKK